MKRASYREGIHFIAANDEVDCLEHELVARQITTALVAELFGVAPAQVATDVLRARSKNKRAPRP